MQIKKKTMAGMAGLILILLVSGCAMMPGGVAPSNIPIEGRRYTNLGRATETDSRIYLLGIIPVSGANTTRDAIDAAIRSKRGDALINITVESYSQWWIILTRMVTRVDGEVIRFQ